MHTHTHEQTHTPQTTYTHPPTHKQTCPRTPAHARTHTYTHTQTRTHAQRVCVCVCACVCVCVCVCICVYHQRPHLHSFVCSLFLNHCQVCCGHHNKKTSRRAAFFLGSVMVNTVVHTESQACQKQYCKEPESDCSRSLPRMTSKPERPRAWFLKASSGSRCGRRRQQMAAVGRIASKHACVQKRVLSQCVRVRACKNPRRVREETEWRLFVPTDMSPLLQK